MFGFLINSVVNDDAVRLKTFVDLALYKYAKIQTYKNLQEKIEADFDENARYTDNHQVSFVFPAFVDFQFCFDSIKLDKSIFPLNVIGRGKYAGFMLTVVDEKRWNSSVSDGIVYRATGGAKKLASVLEKKFSIGDMSKLINQFR